MQVTVVSEQPEFPMTVIGEQLRPTPTVKSCTTMPSRAMIPAAAGSLAYNNNVAVSHQMRSNDGEFCVSSPL